MIAPLSSAVLRVTPATSHGIASAAVVVARMMGMLLGVSALAAWGLHRFQELTRGVALPLGIGLSDAEQQALVDKYNAAIDAALQTEYREIFLATAVLCVLGALVSLLLPGRARRTWLGRPRVDRLPLLGAARRPLAEGGRGSRHVRES